MKWKRNLLNKRRQLRPKESDKSNLNKSFKFDFTKLLHGIDSVCSQSAKDKFESHKATTIAAMDDMEKERLSLEDQKTELESWSEELANEKKELETMRSEIHNLLETKEKELKDKEHSIRMKAKGLDEERQKNKVRP